MKEVKVTLTLTDAQHKALLQYSSDMQESIEEIVGEALITELITLSYYDKRKDDELAED